VTATWLKHLAAASAGNKPRKQESKCGTKHSTSASSASRHQVALLTPKCIKCIKTPSLSLARGLVVSLGKSRQACVFRQVHTRLWAHAKHSAITRYHSLSSAIISYQSLSSFAIIPRYHQSLSSFAHLFHHLFFVQVSCQASGAEHVCTSPLCV